MAMAETLDTARLTLRRLGPDDLVDVHGLFASEGHQASADRSAFRQGRQSWTAVRHMSAH